jgi:oligosaccharide repeat unit polymerase
MRDESILMRGRPKQSLTASILLFLIRPDAYIFAMWLVSFAIPAWILLGGGAGQYLDKASLTATTADIRSALAATSILPIAAIIVGLFHRGAAIPPPRPFHLNRRKLRLATFAAIAVTVAAQLFLLRMIGFSRISTGLVERVVLYEGLNYFVSVACLATGLVPVALYLYFVENKTPVARLDMLLLVALLVCGFGGAVLTGQKTTFALPLLVGLLLFLIARRVNVLKISVFAAVFGGLYFFWDKILREYIVLGYFVEGPKVDVLGFIKASWANTFPQFESLIITRLTIPQYQPFYRGATYFPMLVAWVPRRWWPGKPLSPSGVLADLVFPDLEYGNTIPPGLLGEAWMNAGTWGIVIVSVFVSWFLWHQYARCKAATTWSRVRYAIYLSSFFGFLRGESLGSLVSLLIVLLPSLLFVKMATSTGVVSIVRNRTTRVGTRVRATAQTAHKARISPTLVRLIRTPTNVTKTTN